MKSPNVAKITQLKARAFYNRNINMVLFQIKSFSWEDSTYRMDVMPASPSIWSGPKRDRRDGRTGNNNTMGFFKMHFLCQTPPPSTPQPLGAASGALRLLLFHQESINFCGLEPFHQMKRLQVFQSQWVVRHHQVRYSIIPEFLSAGRAAKGQ